MNRKQKILSVLCLVTLTLLISSVFVPLRIYAYDWNETTTVTLNEYDNVAYGVIEGNHDMENQYLETIYATQIRYIREASSSSIAVMANNSNIFRKSFDSAYYNSYDRFFYDESEWKNHPTYIKATNNTGYGPNLNITTGLNNQGGLSLKDATTLELEADIIYLYTVNLKAGEFYDLNIRTTNLVTYFVYFGEYLSYVDTTDGVNRDVQPLFSREKGEYSIFFYSTVDNYIIIEPRDIKVHDIDVDSPVASRFVNEPDTVWNESKHLFEENRNKEHIHAFYINIPKGTYEFKYIRFDTTYGSTAYLNPSAKYYDSGMQPSLLYGELDDIVEKSNWYFEYDTNILIYITSDTDVTDWVEFDYILSIIELDLPVLEVGVEYSYQDDILNFGVNVEQTQLVYLNHSGGGSLNLYVSNQPEEDLIYSTTYTMEPLAEDSTKLILEPGFYYFMRTNIGTYDFDILLSTVDYELYNDTKTFSLEQENGEPENYKLFKFEAPDNQFANYNMTFLMQNDYTVDLEYDLFIGNYPRLRETNGYVFGQQQVGGSFQAYDTNNTQILSFFALEPSSVRYLLIRVLDVYNNTGYSWSNYGDVFVNQTSVQLSLIPDPDYPDAFNSVNVNFIYDAFLDVNNSWSGSYDFDDLVNDYELYIINTTVPEYTWYKIKIVIENGYRNGITYSLPNSENIRPDEFWRDAVYNKYYYKDGNSGTYFVQYDSSNVSHVTYEIEFGVLAPELVFMFSVNHVGYNGSISIEFIPYACTILYGVVQDAGGLSAGAIIALAIIGGLIGAGIIAAVVVKVVIPKVKAKTPSSPSY